MDEVLSLCVLVWAYAGRDAELIAYEDHVLQLLPDHGGTLLQRARNLEGQGQPLEVHLLQFPSEAALDSYMKDEQRLAFAIDRDLAIERTEILRVHLV